MINSSKNAKQHANHLHHSTGRGPGWAFQRLFTSETQRRKALPSWLHHYNHHRPHTAIGNQPPITRLTNLPGHYT